MVIVVSKKDETRRGKSSLVNAIDSELEKK